MGKKKAKRQIAKNKKRPTRPINFIFSLLQKIIDNVKNNTTEEKIYKSFSKIKMGKNEAIAIPKIKATQQIKKIFELLIFIEKEKGDSCIQQLPPLKRVSYQLY